MLHVILMLKILHNVSIVRHNNVVFSLTVLMNTHQEQDIMVPRRGLSKLYINVIEFWNTYSRNSVKNLSLALLLALCITSMVTSLLSSCSSEEKSSTNEEVT